MLRPLIFSILIMISVNIFAESKIYLIRHASVQIEDPGRCDRKASINYREQYNTNSIHSFDPDIVLKKIDLSETVEMVFCSPQLRAIQTAVILFNNQVYIKINANLKELDYSVIRIPIIKLPIKIWLTASRISWMSGINGEMTTSYKDRKQNLENYSDEIINYAEIHGVSVVIAHGMVNRELIKILKKRGWKFDNRDGYGNLSVNCLIK